MAKSLRNFFESYLGKATAIGLSILGIVLIVQSIRSNLGDSDAARLSQTRHYVDAVTGKDFVLPVTPGTSYPVKAPSGGNTGYPAEECWWTKDGKVKSSPTYVLVKMYKNEKGPTFCPDCGRLVVPHNPAPDPRNPPPTEAEYRARHGAAGFE